MQECYMKAFFMLKIINMAIVWNCEVRTDTSQEMVEYNKLNYAQKVVLKATLIDL